MEHIQIYATPELKACLLRDAIKLEMSLSELVTLRLEEAYGLPRSQTQALVLPEAERIVLNEVEGYIRGLSPGESFDLLSASDTFATLPRPTKASIGKIFAAETKSGMRFQNVSVCINDAGKIVRSKNRAAIYKKM